AVKTCTDISRSSRASAEPCSAEFAGFKLCGLSIFRHFESKCFLLAHAYARLSGFRQSLTVVIPSESRRAGTTRYLLLAGYDSLMPLYVRLILIAAWAVWLLRFGFTRPTTRTPEKRDTRARWGMVLQGLAFLAIYFRTHRIPAPPAWRLALGVAFLAT